MKIKSLLLALLFAFATTAFGATIQLLSEDFSETEGKGSDIKTTNTGTTQITTSGALETYFPWASTGSNVRTANGAIRFGTTSATGTVTTKSLDFSSAKTIVTAEVKGTQSECPDAVVFEINGVTKSATFTSLMGIVEGEGYETVSVEFSAEEMVEGSYGLTIYSVFETSGEPRFFMNSLTVTQVTADVDAVQLAAPADLAVEFTHESATASWTAVENASGYSVVFVNGETETEYETTETSITFENLSAETAYSVKVAAVGNDVSYLTSEYSTASFSTEAAPEGEWKVLFYEEFADTDNVSSETGSTSLKTDNAPWVDWSLETPIYKAYASGGSVRLSLKADPGYAITTNLSFQALSTRITASVKGYPEADAVAENLVVTIGETPVVIPLTDLTTTTYTTYTYETSIAAGYKPVKISVSGGDDLRTLVDSFKIEQFASSTLTQLPAPAEVTATVASCYSANISWAAVTGAASYSVTIQAVDADGNNVGDPIVKPIGNTETSLLVEGLQDGTSYNVSVVAIGDGATGLDSDAATASFATAADPYKPTFSVTDVNGEATEAFTAPLTDPIVVNVSAVVGEEAATVVAGTMPEGATFVDGVFTWTPMTEEVGTVVTVDFTVTNEGGTYTKTITITVAEALPLTMGAITASDVEATSAILSWDALPKATSYTYDIWYGSSIVTNGVDMETFFDFEGVSKGVIPFDVTIKGANRTYADNKDFDFEHNVVCFNDDTGYVITKLYPKAVTNLSAYFVKKSAGTEEGFTGNPVTVYASSDDGATWVQVASYAAADLAADEVRVFEFDAALNYTRFKFEWQKVEMNFGISCIAATYTGAGTKMFAENQTTTDTTITIPKGLVANTEYIVRIKASNDAGDSAYQYLRFATKKADPATVIIIQ
ncbi:MAG: fibronectin type III domain-containing protein [Kiritimatiellae bacterium]|nr:fibronectin type III domain-containing protein [Kiritimatiellia bacterium]